MFTPSEYQAAIFRFLADVANKASLIIEAVAGSGKTTTIVKALENLPKFAKIIFLAFNKSIATELSTRVPSNVNASTFHALCLKALRGYFGKVPWKWVDGDKVTWILCDMFPKVAGKRPPEFQIYASFVKRLVSLAKNAGIGVLIDDTVENWIALIMHHDLTLDNAKGNEQRAIEIARDVLRTSTAQAAQRIDFDDMLYLSLVHNVRFDKYDFVFVDEYQDTNSVQQAIIERLMHSNSRLCVVGDTHQAIYGFRGADAEAMKRGKAKFNLVELPLSICYRCAKNVVNFAKKYVPHIEASPDAIDGVVKRLERYTAQTFTSTDAVICRNVAPLVKLAYALIAKAIGVKILGREIGQGLIALVSKMDASDVDDLLTKLDAYRRREVNALIDKGYDQQADALADKCECVVYLVNALKETSRTLQALIANIQDLFSDSNTGRLTLCTAHKSKGLEFKRVFILDFDKLMPSKYATKDWQLEQENNLIYVAVTRAREELYFIESDAMSDNVADVTLAGNTVNEASE